MEKSITFCILLCIWAASVMAQAENMAGKTLFLNTAFGVQVPAFSNLNGVLSKEGYLPLNKLYFSRGGGFYTIFPRIPVASMFNLCSYTASHTKENKSNWVRATQAGTSLGLVIKNSSKFQLIPYGGLVYSWFGVRVSNNAPGEADFASYLSAPANQHHLSSNGFMANFGLHVARTQLGKGKFGQSIVAGLRAGYYLPLGNQTWKTNTLTLTNGPNANSGGFYTSLIIGLAQ